MDFYLKYAQSSCIDKSSLEKDFGPWESIADYLFWLAENGIDSPADGRIIGVKPSADSDVRLYVYNTRPGVEMWIPNVRVVLFAGEVDTRALTVKYDGVVDYDKVYYSTKAKVFVAMPNKENGYVYLDFKNVTEWNEYYSQQPYENVIYVNTNNMKPYVYVDGVLKEMSGVNDVSELSQAKSYADDEGNVWLGYKNDGKDPIRIEIPWAKDAEYDDEAGEDADSVGGLMTYAQSEKLEGIDSGLTWDGVKKEIERQVKNSAVATMTVSVYDGKKCLVLMGNNHNVISYIPIETLGIDTGEIASVPKPTMTTTTDAAGRKYIALSCTDADAKIYYTTDGTTPTKDSDRYVSGSNIEYTDGINLVAVAINEGSGLSSESLTFVYVAPEVVVYDPVITITNDGKIKITWTNSGCLVKYTTNGATPTLESPSYTEQVNVPAGCTAVKAVVVVPTSGKNYYSNVVTKLIETQVDAEYATITDELTVMNWNVTSWKRPSAGNVSTLASKYNRKMLKGTDEMSEYQENVVSFLSNAGGGSVPNLLLLQEYDPYFCYVNDSKTKDADCYASKLVMGDYPVAFENVGDTLKDGLKRQLSANGVNATFSNLNGIVKKKDMLYIWGSEILRKNEESLTYKPLYYYDDEIKVAYYDIIPIYEGKLVIYASDVIINKNGVLSDDDKAKGIYVNDEYKLCDSQGVIYKGRGITMETDSSGNKVVKENGVTLTGDKVIIADTYIKVKREYTVPRAYLTAGLSRYVQLSEVVIDGKTVAVISLHFYPPCTGTDSNSYCDDVVNWLCMKNLLYILDQAGYEYVIMGGDTNYNHATKFMFSYDEVLLMTRVDKTNDKSRLYGNYPTIYDYRVKSNDKFDTRCNWFMYAGVGSYISDATKHPYRAGSRSAGKYAPLKDVKYGFSSSDTNYDGLFNGLDMTIFRGFDVISAKEYDEVCWFDKDHRPQVYKIKIK